MNAETIRLKSERAPKVRTGLYIEEELLAQIKAIADHNDISVNEAMVLLIKRGIQGASNR